MVNQFFVRVVYDVMCWHILHTPCLIKPVFDQFTNCPVDLVFFSLGKVEDVEDDIVNDIQRGRS
jgi:hypothetical protein